MSEGIVAVSHVSFGTRLAQTVEQASSNVHLTSMADLVTTQYQMAPNSPTSGASSRTDTIANQILSSVDEMRQDYQRLVGKTEKMLEPGPAESQLAPKNAATISNDATQSPTFDSPANVVDATREILSMQFDIGRLMVSEQLVSSAAGKSNQNLDTLLRGQ